MKPCPGCGALFPEQDAPKHDYFVSSPACFGAFGDLLARSYADPSARGLHQLRVDAWVGQHPGPDERRANRGLAVCLMTLKLFVEDGVNPALGPTLHKKMVEYDGYFWLQPPVHRGSMTVVDVLAEHSPTMVRTWAREVWQAWGAHHETVQRWLELTGTAVPGPRLC